MKLLYIATAERTKEIPAEWHALDLGNGQQLVCIRWRDELPELRWAERPDVIRLPHPIFQSTAVIPDEHLAVLRGRFQLDAGATVHHVIAQAAKDNPWMRVHAL